MKENFGKIILTLVIAAVLYTFVSVIIKIFSNPSYTDMAIVWLIFSAESLKKIITGGWNSSMCVAGFLSLVVFIIYYIVRAFSIEKKRLDPDSDNLFEEGEGWKPEDENQFKKWGKPFGYAALILYLTAFSLDIFAACIPNAKQAAVIYVVPKMINNADLREIPPNLFKLVNEGLKEMIVSVKGDAKDAVNTVKDSAKEAVAGKIQEGANAIKNEIAPPSNDKK